jgi:hypothetical protein
MGGVAIWLDPFGMLNPQIVVNLLPELGVGVDLVRHGNWLIWNVHLSPPPLSRLPSCGVGSLHGGKALSASFFRDSPGNRSVPKEESTHRHLSLSFSRGIRILISGVFVQV